MIFFYNLGACWTGAFMFSLIGDDKTLFVKNLTENVTEDMLKDFFSPAEVEEIRLPKKRDGLCKG